MTPRKQNHTSSRILLFAVCAVLLPAFPAATARGQSSSVTFPQTGKTVQGKFLAYWNNHGGVAQQGYPLSDEMQQTSDTNGKVYTVQYFERAVFEMHPENPAPNDVLLSLLGNFVYKQKYPNGAASQQVNSAASSVLFKETGHRVGGSFLSYWQGHGGLAQQGYPISEEFQEKSDLDGKTYKVQYFERAVFEMHPENKPPYDVLLSQLGAFQYKKLTARHLDVFEQVWSTVRDNYVYTDFRGLNWPAIHDEYAAKIKASPDEAGAYKLIAEMIQKLGDRHSGYEDPEQTREDEAMQRGELKLSGIGVLSQQIDKAVRISYVIPASPADKAGLRPFDTIRAVNGTPLVDSADAPRLIRGPAGTSVTLTIESPGKVARDVVIVRDNVTFAYHAVAQRLPGTNIAYLNMPTFSTFGIAKEARDQISKLAASGPLDGLIIDVRQNGGGFLSELVEFEKVFIDGGVAGYEATRTEKITDRIPAGQTLAGLRGKPVVVLTSNLCESACERFSVAMHDLHRGTIIGTTTAGNTETVYPYDLSDGSRLLLAQATFVRPDGTSIEDKGLVPDTVVDVPWYQFSLADDPQMQSALQAIKGK